MGLGALAFAFVEPEQAGHWVKEYYDIIKSSDCVPISHTVNPNVAVVSGMSVHPDGQEAIRRGEEAFKFFSYSLGYVGIYGQHRPGRSRMWQRFLEVKDDMKSNPGHGGIGTPDEVRRNFERYERVGMDQVIFIQQCGRAKHEHICDSLNLFAREVMPAFKERDAARQRDKAEELAPYIRAALDRKNRLRALPEDEIPLVESFGRKQRTDVGIARADTMSDRGGAINVPLQDPHAPKTTR